MPEKKKILFVRQTSVVSGGIENQMMLLARAAAARGEYEPALLTTDAGSVLAGYFKSAGHAVHAVSMERLNIFSAASKAELALDFGSVAVVESHMFRESFIARLLKRRHPHLVHAFRVHTYVDCSWIAEWRKRAYHWLDRLTSAYVDCYIANGGYLKNELIERAGIAADKVSVVLNGSADLDHACASTYSGELPLTPRVAMVANLIAHKGHDVLIDCLSLLKAEGLEIRARLIGSDSGEPEHVAALKASAREKGVLAQLEFFGYTSDVAAALKGIDVVVLPSDSEGLPNCVLEGMCLKKIVVATRVGAVEDVIKDGVNGFSHAPRSPAALAAILREIFSTPASALGPLAEAGRRTWENGFSVERMIREFSMVYEERFSMRVF